MRSIFILILFLLPSIRAYAYYESYPPYKFGETPYKQLAIEPFEAKGDHPSFLWKYDGLLLPKVFQFDIDRNGLQDYIVLLQIGVNTFLRGTDIYLQKQKGRYQKISFEGTDNAIGDFVDINQDGRYEVIITSMCSNKEHNFFTYNIYEFHNYKLVNADKKYKGFPKFIWFTYKPNDKDTTLLSKEEKQKHIDEKNASIQYSTVLSDH